jgi:predicted ATP-dependent endonuclease of OLD family
MKITSLKISNILTFKYYEQIDDAEEIIFEEGLNIIIGENGAGKSTALEVLNFLFKRVIYKQFNVNEDFYSRKSTLTLDEKKQILVPANNQSYGEFRLDTNWDSDDKPQKIKLEIKLDNIDLQNLEHLKNNLDKLKKIINSYTVGSTITDYSRQEVYTLEITLQKNNRSFSISTLNGNDFGFDYLVNYNLYKELISLYNLESPDEVINPLFESFTLIGSYRNYHSFSSSISLRDQPPSLQIQKLTNQDFSKSLNSSDQSEPSIFNLVRLRVAEKHFDLIAQKFDLNECEKKANALPFLIAINAKLKIVNLECKIKLIELRTWQYSFQFFDIKRKKVLTNINSLSAGQKAIVHLVFEAYGKGNLKGGLVIIDEPEIHLHYQFQNEYLQVIRELNKEQKCQYILVTHSEALISSSTINQVKRFSLDNEGYTRVKGPHLSTSQRMLIKILDNTRSTYAFFSKKVLLVEGDTDRYFFKSVFQQIYPDLDQEIAILYMGGKGGYEEWSNLFESFGLIVYCIADLDFSIDRFYPLEKGKSLKTTVDVDNFKLRNTDWEQKIKEEYKKNIFILKNGDLEHYLQLSSKNLSTTIDFCNNTLTSYLQDKSNLESREIKNMIKIIAE